MELPTTRRFVTASAARLAVAGAIAALGEGVATLVRAPSALPVGKLAYVAMLVALYAGAAGIVGAVLGLFAALWSRGSDAGAFVAAAFAAPPSLSSPERAAPQLTRRAVWCYIAAGISVAAVLYPASLAFCRDALGRFHHTGLIGAVVAAVSVASLLGALVLWPLVASLLGLVPPRTRVAVERVTPGGVVLLVWLIGLALVMGGLAFYLVKLQAAPRLSVPQRAAKYALVATITLVASAPSIGLLARALGRHLTGAAWRSPRVVALGFAALLVVLVGGVAGIAWATVKQLDLVPFAALGVLLAVFAALSLLPRSGPPPQTRAANLAVVLLTACGALALGVRLGARPLLRRVAMAHTGLMAPIARALQFVSDRDRDGYASLLGGGDCDDSDASVHPGAFDWPDDGVDQDCNGNSATTQKSVARTYATLPADVAPKLAEMNILFITSDAVRADHLSAYGYKRQTSPVIDALAAEGVRFANAWSHAPSTRYSIPAILTGRYPSTIKIGSGGNWPPDLHPDNRLLSEIVKDLGYYTGGTFTYHYFAPGWKLNQGYDEYDYSLQTLHSMGGDPAKTRGTSALQLTEKNLDFLTRNAGKKFFLWTHYYDTHFAFEPHPDAPETDFGKSEMDLYDGEIRYTDLQLGRLFAKLKELGLWDKTIIVITSDHGEGFGEHNLPASKRHGYHLYRNETKVPLIVRVPGLPPRVVTTAASHVDILPTLLNLLGRPPTEEPQLLGDSLVGPMLGTEIADRNIFQEVWYEGPTSKKAVVSNEWHFIRNLVPEDTRELYDMAADPEEEHNVEGAAVEARLDHALAAWMDAIAIPDDFAKKVDGAVSMTAIEPKQKLGNAIGDWLVLEGVDVMTERVARDGEAEVDLIWRVVARAPSGWRIFTHFVATNGQRINADHQPIEGLLPLQQARPGTYLRDRIKIKIPPNFPVGKLQVVTGLWRPPNERASAKGAHVRDNAVDAATLEVTP